MRKILLVLFGVLLSTFAWGDREISGTVSSNSLYISGTTMEMEFTLDFASPDMEWAAFMELTFPAGMTPVETPADIGTLQFNNITDQTVAWGAGLGDTSMGYLSDTDGPFVFSLEVQLDAGLSGDQTMVYHCAGDAYGAAPHEFTDNCVISPALDNDLVAVSVMGNTTPAVGTSETYQVGVYNPSSTDADTYSIELFNDGASIGSVAGTTTISGAVVVYDFSWTPDVAGEAVLHAVVTFDADENASNNQTPDFVLNVQAFGTAVATIGTDITSQNYVPLNYFYQNSLVEHIYYASEINLGGVLNTMQYHYNFTEVPVMSDINIWVGETTLTDLSAGYIPSTDLTPIYSGAPVFEAAEGYLNITLDSPYAYDGGNLVVLFERVMDTLSYASSDQFFMSTDEVNTSRTLFKKSDTVDFDPTIAYDDGTATGEYSNVNLFFMPEGMGSITGTVTSAGTPVADATVTIDGNSSSTMTNASGEYTFAYVMAGTVDLTVSKNGFIDGNNAGVVVVEDETTTADITMDALVTVMVSGYVYGNDYPTVGIADAAVTLAGYENYDVVTDANGMYSFAAVYVNNDYEITIVAEGYSTYTATITVVDANLVVGDITVLEVISPAGVVVATPNADPSEVDLVWGATGSLSGFDFNGTTLPDNWVFGEDIWTMEGDGYLTGTGTSASGFHNAFNDVVAEDGVLEFVWQRTSGSDTIAQGCFVRSDTGNFTTGSGYIFVFTAGGLYICGTVDGGSLGDPWVADWTSSANLNMGLGADNVITISMQGSDFEMYINGVLELTHTDATYASGVNSIGFFEETGDVVKFDRYSFEAGATIARSNEIAHAVVSNSNKSFNKEINLAYCDVTAISHRNVPAVGPKISTPIIETTINHDRALESYKIYRLLEADQGTFANWTMLAEGVTDTTYTDGTFGSAAEGVYKYAVVAIHTGDVEAEASFSNTVEKGVVGTATFIVVASDGVVVEGAAIELTATDGDLEHVYTATTDAVGNAVIENVWYTMYDLEVTASGFNAYAQDNVDFSDNFTFNITLNELSLPPVGLEIQEVQDNTATISWLAPGAGGGEVLLEGFETWPPAGWSFTDVDGDGLQWDDGSALGIDGHEGVGLAYSASYDNTAGALTPDNWLISPVVDLGLGTTVNYWVAAQDDAWAGEHYGVYISTTGTDTNDFTLLFEETMVARSGAVTEKIVTRGTRDQGTWYEKTVDLSDYSGQCYLAFRHFNVTDMFYLDLDDVTIGAQASTRSLTGYKVYLDGTYVETLATSETVYSFSGLDLGTVYEAGVSAVYTGDIESEIVTITITTTEDGGDLAPVLSTKLGVNYPNPFNPVTNINFSLKTTENVSVQVYNIKGELVNTLLNESLDAGDYHVAWEGYDNNLCPCASGVYFYKMKAGTYTSTKKMILMK